MAAVKRSPENPILIPASDVPWESEASFNPSVVLKNGVTHLFYRAEGKLKRDGKDVEVSSIGHTASKDGVRFDGERNQLVAPTEPWERYGCEDPRVTEFEGRYFIFYTAVSAFSADGIKVAVAITRDFKTIEEKHLVTPFNAKAMALFPERVNGKIAALLTVNTDRPPSRICTVFFDRIEDIWSPDYWQTWYADWKGHIIPIEQNDERDQVEVGSAPLKTRDGWLIFYSYIYNYFSPPAIFGIQAALLALNDPRKVVGEVKRPFLVPQEEYEYYGRVPHIVFPSGALIKKGRAWVYYGATDTVSCVATMPLAPLIEQLTFTEERNLLRFGGNPIISPIADHPWESKATFNPAAVYEGGAVHILYRAMGDDNTSVIGYARARDGVHVDERLPEPIYVPREPFEQKLVAGGNSGCEDPRMTRVGDTLYMCYTAYDGTNPPRVALTSISIADFLARRWQAWAKPVLISPPGQDDKDAILFPRKIKGKYWFLHRTGTGGSGSDIWIDSVADLAFDGMTKFLGGTILMQPRESAWDSRRIGIASPPLETEYGWLLFYHGISRRTGHYNIRAALLELDDPTKILYRTHDPILEPTEPYEREGIVSNVVFPCGAVIRGKTLHVYYGGADKVVGVASIDTDVLITGLAREAESGYNS